MATKPQCSGPTCYHLPPRSSRSDPRPPHLVHDFGAADSALPDSGFRRDPVLGRPGAKAAARVVVGSEFLPKMPPSFDSGARALTPPYSIQRRKPADSRSAGTGVEPLGRPPQAGTRHTGKRASAVMMIPRDLLDQLERERDIDIPIKYSSVDEPSRRRISCSGKCCTAGEDDCNRLAPVTRRRKAMRSRFK